MLKERVGIFSTRSPHRPNPVGITLAKIDRVDKQTRTVHLSGIDLVDGTPVLDIKPYVPGKMNAKNDDALVSQGLRMFFLYILQPTIAFRMLAWLIGSPFASIQLSMSSCLVVELLHVWGASLDGGCVLGRVQWRDPSLATVLQELAASSIVFKDSSEAFVSAIEQVLRVDVRSKDQTRRMVAAENELILDNARVTYCVDIVKAESGMEDFASVEITGVERHLS